MVYPYNGCRFFPSVVPGAAQFQQLGTTTNRAFSVSRSLRDRLYLNDNGNKNALWANVVCKLVENFAIVHFASRFYHGSLKISYKMVVLKEQLLVT